MVQVQDVTEAEDGPTLRQRGGGNNAAAQSDDGQGEENGDLDVVAPEQEVRQHYSVKVS